MGKALAVWLFASSIGIYEPSVWSISQVLATAAILMAVYYAAVVRHSTGVSPPGRAAEKLQKGAKWNSTLVTYAMMDVRAILECTASGPKSYSKIRMYLDEIAGSEVGARATGQMIRMLLEQGLIGPPSSGEAGKFQLTDKGKKVLSE